MSWVKSRIDAQLSPWQFLNFLPLPHGQGAFRGVFSNTSLTTVCCLVVDAGCGVAAPPDSEMLRSTSSDELVWRLLTPASSASTTPSPSESAGSAIAARPSLEVG